MSPTTVLARGDFYLDDIQFTTDPRVYERQWKRRGSRHATLGGGVTIQSAARSVQDLVLRLESGGNHISRAVADALDARAGALAPVYAFRDWHRTEGTAYLADFELEETGLPELFGYSLTLWVRTLALLRGAPYTGG